MLSNVLVYVDGTLKSQSAVLGKGGLPSVGFDFYENPNSVLLGGSAASERLGFTAGDAPDYNYSGTTNLSQITFAAGSATATLVIDPTPDATVEGNESVIVSLVSGAGYVVGSSASATGYIEDTPTAMSFGPSDNASAVLPRADLLLTFSEPVVARSGQFTITDTM